MFLDSLAMDGSLGYGSIVTVNKLGGGFESVLRAIPSSHGKHTQGDESDSRVFEMCEQ